MLKYQLVFCIGKFQCQISYSTMTLVTLLVKLLGQKTKKKKKKEKEKEKNKGESSNNQLIN